MARIFAALSLAVPALVMAQSAELVATDGADIGSEIEVEWTGPGGQGDFLSLARPDQDAREYETYVSVRKGSPVNIPVPENAGEYELRYVDAENNVVLARRALAVNAVTAGLTAPGEVVAGSQFDVNWDGPGHRRDFISIDAPDAKEREYGPYGHPHRGNPLTLTAPDAPGEYALRYHLGRQYTVIGTRPLVVKGSEATVGAPAQVAAGNTFPVEWTGPANPKDFITIVPADAAEGNYSKYFYPSRAQANELVAPDEPGDYEVRYLTGQNHLTLASAPVKVTATSAAVTAPGSVPAGSEFEFTWIGPENDKDYLTLVPAGMDEGKYDRYWYVRKGQPGELPAPDEPGEYELRYLTGQTYATLARAPVTVTPVSASVTSPGEVKAGSVFEVSWTGPGNRQDFLTVVPKGEEEKAYGGYAYTRRGNPVRLEAPREIGEYEVRYLTGQSRRTLASAPVEVVPSREPGALKVVGDAGATASAAELGAVELILDASGSMLQQLDGRRRIDVAKESLVDLTRDTLPDGAALALRVFGQREPGACRTDLEIPLGPLARQAAVSRIQSIEAKNLAKTPIADSLSKVPEDLAGVEGPVTVILVTDGEETCDGDPAMVIERLGQSGYDIRVNIVGFAIDELMLKETFRAWARLGNGAYFDAGDAAALSRAIRESIRLPFEVLREDAVVAAGVVNGDAVTLPAGAYRVRVLSKPVHDLEAVVEPGGETRLRLQ